MEMQNKIEVYIRTHRNLHEVVMDMTRIRFNPNKISLDDIKSGNYIVSLHTNLKRTWKRDGVPFNIVKEIEPIPILIS